MGMHERMIAWAHGMSLLLLQIMGYKRVHLLLQNHS